MKKGGSPNNAIKNGGGKPPMTSKQTMGKGKAAMEAKRHRKANMKQNQNVAAANKTNSQEKKTVRSGIINKLKMMAQSA